MTTDEKEIRELVSTWIEASKAGDTEKVLSLMTDDVVFLTPGRPPMTKADFAAASRAQTQGGAAGAPTIDGQSEIQEIQIAGDWALLWTKLRVVMTPPGGSPLTRAGFTLSVVRRQAGRWLFARDANLLAPVANAGK